MTNTNNILADLQARSLVDQISDEEGIKKHLEKPQKVYCGFDPTADSLHVGHLLPILALRRFQMAGHQPIILVGGATGLIGDPSGKLSERSLNDEGTVVQWSASIKQQLERFIDFSGDVAGIVTNNLDWTADVSLLSFLRDIGKNFSVNALLKKQSVQLRLEREETGISFTEFSYALLQANDFFQLYKKYGCTVQIGGSDQWGNISEGISLVRKLLGKQAFALTFPLLTKSDGEKFGKTASGAIWLDPNKTSPYAFYQFWLNVADEDAISYLYTFSFLSIDAIRDIAERMHKHPEKREAQNTLADAMTHLVHGEESLRSAKRISEAFFSGEIKSLWEDDIEQLIGEGMPSNNISAPIPLLQALVEGKVVGSKSQGRQLIGSGAIHVNGEKVSETNLELTKSDALHNRFFFIKKGKKYWHVFVCA